MVIHKWEADIYIGYPPALHLQCISPNPLNPHPQVSASAETQTHREPLLIFWLVVYRKLALFHDSISYDRLHSR
jgi:hypothetical protein